MLDVMTANRDLRVWATAVGTSLSAYMILAANAFMQPNGSTYVFNGMLNFTDNEVVSGALTSAFLPGDVNRPALERQRLPIVGKILRKASLARFARVSSPSLIS